MAQEVQRVRYFTGEFLQEADFNGEQAYHIRMRYLHNRWLHTVGIATGFTVTSGPGALQVTVSPGVALAQVTEVRIPEFQGEDVAKELVTINPTIVSVAGAGNAQIYVVASFAEQQAQPAPSGNTRWLERPDIRALPAGSPAPDNQATLNAGGTGIASVDLAERRGAGMRGEIEATQLRLPVPGIANAAQWPRLAGGAANRLDVTGTLNLTAGGNITLAGGGTVDGRDVSVDGTNLDAHVANLALHVTDGNNHDHTAGRGAPIPWAAITGAPDFLIKALVVIVGSTGAAVRLVNVATVARTAVGTYDLTLATAVTNPVYLLSVVAAENLLCRVVSFTTTTARLLVSRIDGTAADPTRLFAVVL